MKKFTVFKCRLQNSYRSFVFVFQNESGPKMSEYLTHNHRKSYLCYILWLIKLQQTEN